MSKEKAIPEHMVVCVDDAGRDHLIPKTTIEGPFFKESGLYVKPAAGSSLASEFQGHEAGKKNPQAQADEFEATLQTITDLKTLEQLAKKHKADENKVASIQARIEQLKAEQK